MVCAALCVIHHLSGTDRSRSEQPRDPMGSHFPACPVPRSAPRPGSAFFAETYFSETREVGLGLVVFFFCLMDFLFLIQLKGSEIHALD